uniref:Uncharacterized protein n=1 Tax=Arundo donax TaxID=35708 RepID=A0A0A9HFV1_ARUDO
MPSPPSSFGLLTLLQAKRQCPLFTSLRPFHRNARNIFSSALIAHRGMSKARRW